MTESFFSKGGLFMSSQEVVRLHLKQNEGEKIQTLEEVLKGSGVSVSQTEENGERMAVFTWNPEDLNKIRTRGAGRKPLSLTGAPSVKDVLEMQKQYGVQKTCQILNISPSTFYRRKKIVKDRYSPEEFGDIPF